MTTSFESIEVRSASCGARVTAVALSEQAIALAMASRDEVVIELFSRQSLQMTSSSTVSESPVTALALCEVVVFASRAGVFAFTEKEPRLLYSFEYNCDDPECAVSDETGLVVALGLSRRIIVLTLTEDNETLCELDGHRGNVTCVQFHGGDEAHLLTSASEDRSFKIWDLQARSCLYESSVLSVSPLVACAVDADRLAVASADGKVRLFQWSGVGQRSWCKELYDIDMTQEEAPLALSFDRAGDNNNDPAFAFEESSRLLVASATSLCAIDVVSAEVTKMAESTIGTAALATFHKDGLVMAAAFEPRAVYAAIASLGRRDNKQEENNISFFFSSSCDLPRHSPLRKEPPSFSNVAKKEPLAWDSFLDNKNKKTTTTTTTPATKGKKTKDMPVTFHRRIKSSGYGAAPVMALGGRPKQPPPPRRKETVLKNGLCCSSYPVDYAGLLSVHQPQHDLESLMDDGLAPILGRPPIRGLAVSGDARALAIASSDGAVVVRKLPIARHRARTSLVGTFDKSPRLCTWSFDSKCLLTTSEHSVDLWRVFGDDNKDNNNVSLEVPRLKIKAKSLTAAAQFFFLDRFLVFADRNRVAMHNYHDGRSKVAHSWPYDDAQNVTALACLNTMLSPLILAAASNRSLRVLDAASGKIVRHIDDAHSKPVHTISLGTPSAATHSIPKDRFDLFATAAADNLVKLWDLRTKNTSCVGALSAHLNRREPLGLAFSPCMRYLACGSEDKQAYIYDLRTASPVARLRGHHSDVVSCVAFNPLHPQLITASYDGRLRFYTTDN